MRKYVYTTYVYMEGEVTRLVTKYAMLLQRM
jgi:hypothetical protein